MVRIISKVNPVQNLISCIVKTRQNCFQIFFSPRHRNDTQSFHGEFKLLNAQIPSYRAMEADSLHSTVTFTGHNLDADRSLFAMMAMEIMRIMSVKVNLRLCTPRSHMRELEL
jgi:hypothetical protein